MKPSTHVWVGAVVIALMMAATVNAQRPASADSLLRQAQRGSVPSVSNEEVLERLRRSGLSRAEIRGRLQEAGYDPALADAYFDRIARGDSLGMSGMAPATFSRALVALGLLESGGSGAGVRSDPSGQGLVTGDVFGRDLFARETSEFVPALAGPVDPDYQLGPGDQVSLVLTGDVERSYRLDVDREGYLTIPDVGQVAASGITLGQLEDRLYGRLSQVYSGVRRGEGATTHFRVSVGQLRNLQVYVTGDAEWPGAYQLNAASTVFHALYQAGGPRERGSFRRIEVRRGGVVVRTIDLYDYLLRGDSRHDIRLRHGDIIFIPTALKQVRIMGAVRRPAIYELLPDDDIRDLLEFAAGVEPGAILRRVQIDRIVPPAERLPGVDRVLIDVDVVGMADPKGPVALRDGDVVQVFSVSDERRNRVSVLGSVRRPGLYEWTPGMTLSALLDRAEGLAESAFRGRAHIYRLNVEDGSRSVLRVPLGDGALNAVRLVDRDSVVVYDLAELTVSASVTIDGLVKRPGRYTFAHGMSIKDLVLAAGGFVPGAYTLNVEVARVRSAVTRGDTVSTVFHIPLMRDFHVALDSVAHYPHAVDALWTLEAEEFELLREDRVMVRRMPGHEELQPVMIMGEVQFPGVYVLHNRQERVAALIARSGGLNSEAFTPGIQVWRNGKLVAVNVGRALADSRSRSNIALLPGDSIHVPRYDPTVLVTGAVGFESRVLYAPGEGLGYYISQAGGYAENADGRRTNVLQQNGERQTRGHWVWGRDPEVGPGSTIFVPRHVGERPRFNLDQALTRVLTTVSTVATLLVVFEQLK